MRGKERELEKGSTEEANKGGKVPMWVSLFIQE